MILSFGTDLYVLANRVDPDQSKPSLCMLARTHTMIKSLKGPSCCDYYISQHNKRHSLPLALWVKFSADDILK